MQRWSLNRAAAYGAIVGFLHAVFLVLTKNRSFDLITALAEALGMAAVWWGIAALRNRLKSAP